MTTTRIALIGDHDPSVTAHRAIPEALRLAQGPVGTHLRPEWVGTASLGGDVPAQLSGYAGVWCVPASPYANTAGALAAIRFARESGRPFLGTCGGFQHALLEYARNVLGLADAEHAERAPDAERLLIARLSCPLVEKAGRVDFCEGSRIRAAYGTAGAEEGYHCNYGLNPGFEGLLTRGGLRVSGRDAEGAVRAVELEGHPFFVATLFQPERAALRGVAPPLVSAFAAAAASWAASNPEAG